MFQWAQIYFCQISQRYYCLEYRYKEHNVVLINITVLLKTFVYFTYVGTGIHLVFS
jgi:hypothetical protein